MNTETMTQQAFMSALQADGFNEAETRSLPAGQAGGEHEHPFDVRALVLAGEISMIVAGKATAYRTGDIFTMASGCRHAEAVGAEGVKYLVGRR